MAAPAKRVRAGAKQRARLKDIAAVLRESKGITNSIEEKRGISGEEEGRKEESLETEYKSKSGWMFTIRCLAIRVYMSRKDRNGTSLRSLPKAKATDQKEKSEKEKSKIKKAPRDPTDRLLAQQLKIQTNRREHPRVGLPQELQLFPEYGVCAQWEGEIGPRSIDHR